MTVYHLSTRMGGWARCIAQSEITCPYSEEKLPHGTKTDIARGNGGLISEPRGSQTVLTVVTPVMEGVYAVLPPNETLRTYSAKDGKLIPARQRRQYFEQVIKPRWDEQDVWQPDQTVFEAGEFNTFPEQEPEVKQVRAGDVAERQRQARQDSLDQLQDDEAHEEQRRLDELELEQVDRATELRAQEKEAQRLEREARAERAEKRRKVLDDCRLLFWAVTGIKVATSDGETKPNTFGQCFGWFFNAFELKEPIDMDKIPALPPDAGPDTGQPFWNRWKK